MVEMANLPQRRWPLAERLRRNGLLPSTGRANWRGGVRSRKTASERRRGTICQGGGSGDVVVSLLWLVGGSHRPSAQCYGGEHQGASIVAVRGV